MVFLRVLVASDGWVQGRVLRAVLGGVPGSVVVRVSGRRAAEDGSHGGLSGFLGGGFEGRFQTNSRSCLSVNDLSSVTPQRSRFPSWARPRPWPYPWPSSRQIPRGLPSPQA